MTDVPHKKEARLEGHKSILIDDQSFYSLKAIQQAAYHMNVPMKFDLSTITTAALQIAMEIPDFKQKTLLRTAQIVRSQIDERLDQLNA